MEWLAISFEESGEALKSFRRMEAVEKEVWIGTRLEWGRRELSPRESQTVKKLHMRAWKIEDV